MCELKCEFATCALMSMVKWFSMCEEKSKYVTLLENGVF